MDAALLRAQDDGAAANPRAIGTAVVSLLSRLAASGPVLLAIDDLQWLDTPSARALEFALRRLEAHRIAVLATTRVGEPSGVPRLPGIDRFETVHLGALSLAALYRIIEGELGRALPRPLLVRIEQACAGNPFYALEIARALESTKVMPGESLSIPADLRELLTERLRKLPLRTREALLKVSAFAQPTIPADRSCGAHTSCRSGSCAPAERWKDRVFSSVVCQRGVCGGVARSAAEVARRARRDRERHARHLLFAQASNDTDERVAEVLHAAAEHALRRGAMEVSRARRAVGATHPGA